MNYPIVIHKDKDSDYGVMVPDLPGCFSAGSTIDEAVEMAKEAVELHLEGLIEDGVPIPEPGTIEQYQDLPEYKGGVWGIVSISPSRVRTRTKRVNITIPHRILDALDRFARSKHETRSGLLVKAAAEYMTRHRSRTRRKPRKVKRSMKPTPCKTKDRV